ncbi:hypothetical protein BGZ99_008541 [Dissophora globulifera]|uniref:Uncharacterized protein n=1 Tax=Dissophora globulifera TaxID=979702 RepID=A0A9P6RVX1_9FUNG|nr:hypothetical protein BGZ99_008541 [Dissophora globulifera]
MDSSEHAHDNATDRGGSSDSSNPLLTRLNQDSAERAQIAAVRHQLGPEGTQAPQVIGDFMGFNASTSDRTKSSSNHYSYSHGSSSSSAIYSSSSGVSSQVQQNDLHEVLRNIRIEGDDDEVNELDGEEEDDEEEEDEDTTAEYSNGAKGKKRALGGLSDAMRAEVISAVSAVDPQQLIGAAGKEGHVS